MSIVTTVRAVPRAAVGAGLGLARLPVSALARVASQTSNEQWPPTMAFEGFEAGVETLVGSLLRDETLVSRGRVRQAKLAQLRRALTLETVASEQREQADVQFQAKREQAEQQRQVAAERAQQREQQLEQQAAQRERAVEQKAAKKAAAAREVKAAQDKSLQRQERAGKATALDKEAEALSAQKQALDAEATVDVIDESIDGTKAARQTG